MKGWGKKGEVFIFMNTNNIQIFFIHLILNHQEVDHYFLEFPIYILKEAHSFPTFSSSLISML